MPEKQRRVTGGRRSATGEILEPPPGVKLLRTLDGHDNDVVVTVAFDPNGGTLASGGYDGSIRLWEPQSGKLLRTLEGQATTHFVTFDPAGRILASGMSDGTVRLWEWRTGELLHTIQGLGGRFGLWLSIRRDAPWPSGRLRAPSSYGRCRAESFCAPLRVIETESVPSPSMRPEALWQVGVMTASICGKCRAVGFFIFLNSNDLR